jgi:hypothetical protein
MFALRRILRGVRDQLTVEVDRLLRGKWLRAPRISAVIHFKANGVRFGKLRIDFKFAQLDRMRDELEGAPIRDPVNWQAGHDFTCCRIVHSEDQFLHLRPNCH